MKYVTDRDNGYEVAVNVNLIAAVVPTGEGVAKLLMSGGHVLHIRFDDWEKLMDHLSEE